MTALCFLHSMAYVISHHAQFLQILTGNLDVQVYLVTVDEIVNCVLAMLCTGDLL